MDLPLKGIKVIEFGNAIFAPLCSGLLAHYGAEVIKIEPPEGDLARLTVGRGDSILFLNRNPGKRSISLELRNPKGIEIIMKLVQQADVLIHNLRPGTVKNKQLDYESISNINPRIVYASLYMYGESGPLADMRGADPWAQAFTGMVESQGNPGEPPYLMGHPICDNTGAILAAYGIMLALFHREHTGKGQEITTSLVNAGIYLQQDALAHYLIEGLNTRKGGRGHYRGLFPYGAYPCKDGDVVTIFGQDNDEWKTICEILGIEYLLQNEKYDSAPKRAAHKMELYPVLDEAFRQKTRAEWQELFRERHLRADPCLDYAELIEHPQFAANDLLTRVNHPRDGKLTMIGATVKLKGTPATENLLPPPILGQHSEEIVKELGYSENEVKSFIAEGIIILPTEDMMKPVTERVDTSMYSSATKSYKKRRIK